MIQVYTIYSFQQSNFFVLNTVGSRFQLYSYFVFHISDQKEITIDETYCWSTDHLGRPIDIYSDPDYRMQCIGYWKENLKSYLITYDQLDAFTKYRCWVKRIYKSTTPCIACWYKNFHRRISLWDTFFFVSGLSTCWFEQNVDVNVGRALLRFESGCGQQRLQTWSCR